MKKQLIYFLAVILYTQTAFSNPEISNRISVTSFKYSKSKKTFKTFLQYVSIKSLKGIDSANVFYRNTLEKEVENYTDYLPLTAGSSYPLTGTLYGVDANFSGAINFGSSSNPSRNQLSQSFARLTASNDLNALDISVSNTLISIGSNYFGGGSSIPIAINTYPNTDELYLATNGNVGIGTTSPSAKLDINGNANISGAINFGSSSNPTRNQLSQSFARITAPNDLNTLDIGVSNTLISIGSNYFGGGSSIPLAINTYPYTNQLYLGTDGNVGIGMTSASEKLSVNGNIKTKKIIITQTGWSDYVFNDDYKLRSLSSLESYINQNKHLPEVPSAKEVEEKGVSVGDNQALLLKKIEELTLYVIGLKTENQQQQKRIESLEKQILKK